MGGGGSSSGNGRRRTTRTSGEPTSGRAVAAAAKKLRDLQRRLKFRGCLAPSVFEAPFEEAAVESLYRDLAARFRLARQTLLAVWLAAVTAASAGLFVGGAALGSSAQHGLLWGAVGASGVLLFALWTCVEADRLARRLLWSGTQACVGEAREHEALAAQVAQLRAQLGAAKYEEATTHKLLLSEMSIPKHPPWITREFRRLCTSCCSAARRASPHFPAAPRARAWPLVSRVVSRPTCYSLPLGTSGPREFLLAAPEARSITNAVEGEPNLAIALALSGRTTDWDAVKRAATRLRHRDYGLRDYYVDVRQAFPELQLYTVTREEYKAGHRDISSGLTPDEEYRRTLGALFALYWLARVGIDGECGLSFGVDDDWAPRKIPEQEDLDGSAALKKRLTFYCNTPWKKLLQLLVDAGMLTERGGRGGAVEVAVPRMCAMLALTAIHDVFKVEALLPRVRPEHAPFKGFAAGDVINDHDVAMYYVLDHFPEALPSFAGLDATQRHSVLFTQSKMSFNHGWLVQAEAPPHALFARFKRVIMAGEANPPDVSFYFVHWLTDLAGAVPNPLDGSERLVLGFPYQVLGSFITSFSVLSALATQTETEVFETYLESYWRDAAPRLRLGAPPSGEHAIAMMRLLCQAQSTEAQESVLAAWEKLSADDEKVLCDEMSRTGIADQHFRASAQKRPGGPAILVYYSPQLVRSLTPDSASQALAILAEVYRRSRKLWPLTPLERLDDDARTVTVRIDQIKELKLEDIRAVYSDGNSWLLYKRNEREAVVECHPIDYLAELHTNGHQAAVLKLWRKRTGVAIGGPDSAQTSRRTSASATLSRGSLSLAGHSPDPSWSRLPTGVAREGGEAAAEPAEAAAEA
uniref:Uncharacterized protein n=1 Tax=Emiliania huxleyi TaxID=2903 RepID=A0A7S3T499_EMIHU